MAKTRARLQDILNDIERHLPAWIAEHGGDGDLCGALAGMAEDAVEGGLAPEDEAWFHDRLRDLCSHYNLPNIEV